MTTLTEDPMTTNTVDELLAEIEAGNKQAEADYEEVIAKLHKGEKIPAKQLRSILDAVGKEPADVRERLDELKHKDRLIAERAQHQANARRMVALREEIEQHGRRIEQELERLRAEIHPQRNELAELQHKQMIAPNYDQELRQCAANRPLIERERELERRIANRNNEGDRREVARINNLLAKLEGGYRPAKDDGGLQELGPDGEPVKQSAAVTTQQIKNLRAQCDRLKEAMRLVDEERAAAERELAEVRTQIYGDQ